MEQRRQPLETYQGLKRVQAREVPPMPPQPPAAAQVWVPSPGTAPNPLPLHPETRPELVHTYHRYSDPKMNWKAWVGRSNWQYQPHLVNDAAEYFQRLVTVGVLHGNPQVGELNTKYTSTDGTPYKAKCWRFALRRPRTYPHLERGIPDAYTPYYHGTHVRCLQHILAEGFLRPS